MDKWNLITIILSITYIFVVAYHYFQNFSMYSKIHQTSIAANFVHEITPKVFGISIAIKLGKIENKTELQEYVSMALAIATIIHKVSIVIVFVADMFIQQKQEMWQEISDGTDDITEQTAVTL